MKTIEIIEQYIPKLPTSQALCTLLQKSYITLPDESSLETIIFTFSYAEQAQDNIDKRENYEKYIQNFINDTVPFIKEDLEKEYKIGVNDYVKISVTDQNVYFIIFKSGEY